MIGYAVIWCSDFKLQAVIRRTRRSVPVGLIDDTQKQSIILARNAMAAEHGVEIGMPTVQALGRSPLLQVESPSAAAELAAGRLLMETALRWVPLIEETGAGILTLDLSGQHQDLWHESAHNVLRRLADAGLVVVVGIGETPSLARIASQTARLQKQSVWQIDRAHRLAQLDRLPLAMAEVEPELAEKLALWGITTLGAFARLSHDAVSTRLGGTGIELWSRLTGRMRRPLHIATLEELFEESYDFDYDVIHREPLLFVLHRAIDSLSERVARSHLVITAVNLLITHTNGSCYARRLRLPEPTLDGALIDRVLSGHLDTLEMESPVYGVRVQCEVSEALSSQRTLFGAGLKNFFQYKETLKRLRDLVGFDQVGSPRKRTDHRVDSFLLATLPKEISELSGQEGVSSDECFLSTTDSPPPMMGLIFRRYPLPLRVKVSLRDGAPLMIESQHLMGIVTNNYGPWKSAGRWWHRGESWHRAEWDVELMNKGVFRLLESSGDWFIEGYYD